MHVMGACAYRSLIPRPSSDPFEISEPVQEHFNEILDIFEKHIWQSCVEIEGYSVAYFDCIAVFEAPYR